MDKLFFRCREEKVCEGDFDGNRGARVIIYALLCISFAFTLMNAAIRLYSTEETHSKLSEAVVAFSTGVLNDGEVFVFSDAPCYEDYTEYSGYENEEFH